MGRSTSNPFASALRRASDRRSSSNRRLTTELILIGVAISSSCSATDLSIGSRGVFLAGLRCRRGRHLHIGGNQRDALIVDRDLELMRVARRVGELHVDAVFTVQWQVRVDHGATASAERRALGLDIPG